MIATISLEDIYSWFHILSMHGFLIPSYFVLFFRRPASVKSPADASQSLPLQESFLAGMESLLAVESTSDPRSKQKQFSERIQREATQLRNSHRSTSVEKEEEQRWEAGVGSGGAFGDRVRQGKAEGIERSAWEWRDEDAILEANRVMEAAKEEAKQATKVSAQEGGFGDKEGARVEGEGARVLGEVAAAEEAFPTPFSAKIRANENPTVRPSQTLLPEQTFGTFRFIDTSSRGTTQTKQVQRAMHVRDKLKAKNAKRKAARI